MSDFGTMVIARRRDGLSMTEQDRSRLEEAVGVIRRRARYRDASGEPFRFRIIESQRNDGNRDLGVLLSEYWGEGIEEGFYGGRTTEELLEHDRLEAEAVRDDLKGELQEGYELGLICDLW
jgi:hypothetical protein